MLKLSALSPKRDSTYWFITCEPTIAFAIAAAGDITPPCRATFFRGKNFAPKTMFEACHCLSHAVAGSLTLLLLSARHVFHGAIYLLIFILFLDTLGSTTPFRRYGQRALSHNDSSAQWVMGGSRDIIWTRSASIRLSICYRSC